MGECPLRGLQTITIILAADDAVAKEASIVLAVGPVEDARAGTCWRALCWRQMHFSYTGGTHSQQQHMP
jgi:hypothetical protein